LPSIQDAGIFKNYTIIFMVYGSISVNKFQIPSTKIQKNLKFQYPTDQIIGLFFLQDHRIDRFGILVIGICVL
jgi:hypothetical protein